MANMTIRNVPDSLYRRLKKEAKSEGRTLSAHVIHLLQQTARRRPSAGERLEELERLVAKQPYTGNLSTKMLWQDRYKEH